VSWGTPQGEAVVETTAWPRGDRERTALPDHRFKRLHDHGARKTPEGRKQVVGPDRHPHRARAPLAPSLLAAQKRLDKQAKESKTPPNKVAESAHPGQGKRLEQRQRAVAVVAKARKDAQEQHAQLAGPASALGPPRERADRDLRTQTIRTVRPRRLEHAWMSFRAVRVRTLTMQGSLDGLLPSLFERSGARIETVSQVVYGVNTAGVSLP
jgi:hypothetical protein